MKFLRFLVRIEEIIVMNLHISLAPESEGGQWLREAGGTLFLPKGGGRFAV